MIERCTHQIAASANAQSGLTLVEILVALAMSQLIVLILSTAVVAYYGLYAAASDFLAIHEIGRGTLDTIAQSVRHAGFATDNTPRSPAVFGLDAHTVPANTDVLDGARPGQSKQHSSDVLALRFAGDSHIANCAGLIPTIDGKSNTAGDNWSIYYVAKDQSGTPNLYCKFNTGNPRKSFSAQSIAQGIDAFKVLYQLGAESPFINATSVRNLDIAASGGAVTTDAAGSAAESAWNKVTAIRIALVVRGNVTSALHRSPEQFQLFDESAQLTPGVPRHDTESIQDYLHSDSRGLARAMFRTTVAIRNPRH